VFFWEIKKTKFFERIWVFMLGQDPLIGMHDVNLFFSIKTILSF
jgi:hypothetical protein